MDNLNIIELYQKLLEIYYEQIDIVEKEEYDQQVHELNELELKKFDYFSLIEKERLTSSNYDQLDIDTKQQLIRYIQIMNELNMKLQSILELWYEQNSTSMKQVMIHRKTLQTYGGINYSDIVSYYFDEKK